MSTKTIWDWPLSETDEQAILHRGVKPEMLLQAKGRVQEHLKAEESKPKAPAGLIPGPPCPNCSHEFYFRTGVCLTCANCGESSSCG